MSDHKAWQAAADAVEAAYFAGFHVRDAEIERLRQLLRDAGVPEWVINPNENT